MVAKTSTKTNKKTDKAVEKAKESGKTNSAKKYFPKGKRLKYLLLALIVLIAGGLLFLGKSLFVAAIVNGVPISRYSVVNELEKQGGKKTIENLVTRSLIMQQAKKSNITIDAAEIQKEIDRITQAVEAQGMKLDDALAYQGTTKEMLEDNIRIQKTVEALLADKLSVSDKDVKKYFEENKASYAKDAKLEDLSEDIKNQLKQDKLSQEFQTWLDKMKTDSKIIYFVNY